jgi:DNA polymerase-3 subunit delta
MIIKSFDVQRSEFSKNNYFLLYGTNDGFKEELINNIILKDFKGEIIRIDEQEINNKSSDLIDSLLTKSLFEEDKSIIISRATDKILKFIQDILKRKISNIKIIINCGLLEKKSKLRNLFEIDKSLIVIPVYEDDARSLTPIIQKFLIENKIKLSRESIDLLIDRSSGDRKNLNVELNKIMYLSKTTKEINFEIIKKLTNLADNHSVSELADSFLLKNQKKISKILNENNYSNDDCILILRAISSKSKRLLKILNEKKDKANIDSIITNYKPPIFWKDKETIKKQANNWDILDLKNKIFNLNDLEFLIKSQPSNSLKLISDYIKNY